MKIALYSAFFSEETLTFINRTLAYLSTHKHDVLLVDRLKKHMGAQAEKYPYFDGNEIIQEKVDFLFSIGGDGTYYGQLL